MSNLTKGLILLLVVIGIGAGLVVWKSNVGTHAASNFGSITKEEVELLLSDVAKTNPMVLKRFAEDPEMKKQQLDNLKQLLAFASQAQKEGLAADPVNRQEMETIRSEVIAVNYDKEINQGKGPMPPFGFIGEDRINAFWGQGGQADKGFFDSLKDKIGLGSPNREVEFQKFLDTKVALLKKSNPEMEREITEEEKTQAREFFAKIEIYQDEYEEKAAAGELDKTFQDKVNLQVKLQQAQFLARQYSETLAEKIKVTDEEVAKYIAEHPEFNSDETRAKAQEILNRAKAGEDFAALADEFTEDPGNMGPDGKKQGGIYKDITKGKMVPPFEQAALALEPGQIAPELVETDYGFHIIKLEKKGEGKDAAGQPAETYDARHILISTAFKDPEMGREMPVKAFVRNKLETEKEKQVIDEIVASNNIQVPEDFTVPEVSEEQIRDMLKQQQDQMQQMQGPPPPADGPGSEPGAEDAPAKPEAK